MYHKCALVTHLRDKVTQQHKRTSKVDIYNNNFLTLYVTLLKYQLYKTVSKRDNAKISNRAHYKIRPTLRKKLL